MFLSLVTFYTRTHDTPFYSAVLIIAEDKTEKCSHALAKVFYSILCTTPPLGGVLVYRLIRSSFSGNKRKKNATKYLPKI